MKRQKDVTIRKAKLVGLSPIMFDRFVGMEANTEIQQKLYLNEKSEVCLPAENISSALSSQNNYCVAQVLQKQWAALARAFMGFMIIEPQMIPFTRSGKNIIFKGFDDDEDVQAGLYIDRRVARVKKGKLSIPSEKERPVLRLPWELTFNLTILKNDVFTESDAKKAFEKMGMIVALGTYRPVFGRFTVEEWE